MKIQVKHTFPCGFKIEYSLFSFFGLFAYTRAKNTLKCRIHGYKCKIIETPEDLIKNDWRNS